MSLGQWTLILVLSVKAVSIKTTLDGPVDDQWDRVSSKARQTGVGVSKGDTSISAGCEASRKAQAQRT